MSEAEMNMIFANNLKKFLDIFGMSQADLSKRLGVSPQSVSNWCKGTKSPRMDKVDAICKIFHCRRSDLLEEDNSEKTYYLDEKAAKLAQEMFEDKQMRSLFHMKKNMDPKRFQAHVDMMKEMYRLEHQEDFPEDWTD